MAGWKRLVIGMVGLMLATAAHAQGPGPGAPASDNRPSTRVASSNGAPVGRISWIGDRPGEQVLQHMTAGAIAAEHAGHVGSRAGTGQRQGFEDAGPARR